MRTVFVCMAGVMLAAVRGVASGPLFLADDARHPHVVISWPTRDGSVRTLEADRPYTSPNERTPLGANLDCFVALGGTRLDKGAGHPAGAIVRVGFYKADGRKLLFEDIARDATIRVRLTGVFFDRPGVPRQATVLQHLKYMPEDLAACGLGLGMMDQFNTFSPTDDLGGKIPPENARMGILDGRDGGGRVRVWREEDGSISLEAAIPYRLLRHTQDPWLRETPGSFFEPNHFHIEVEVLPEEAAGSESGAQEPGAASPRPDGKPAANPPLPD